MNAPFATEFHRTIRLVCQRDTRDTPIPGVFRLVRRIIRFCLGDTSGESFASSRAKTSMPDYNSAGSPRRERAREESPRDIALCMLKHVAQAAYE